MCRYKVSTTVLRTYNINMNYEYIVKLLTIQFIYVIIFTFENITILMKYDASNVSKNKMNDEI